jgi:hypothetical protein
MTSFQLLIPPLNCNHPIKNLERLWLNCTCAYDQFDENIMADDHWDALTVELREREAEWSPYFRYAVPRECILSSTSSGIQWGVPYSVQKLVREGLRMDLPGRVARLHRMCYPGSQPSPTPKPKDSNS